LIIYHLFNLSPAFKQNTQSSRNGLNGVKRKRSVVAFGNGDEDEQTGFANGDQTNGNSQKRKAQDRITLLAERKQLPIWSGRKALVKAVQENDTLIVLGETGSGKTTRESGL
jgi:HrpA-like RNA helicase